jgi:putative addiction module antidote
MVIELKVKKLGDSLGLVLPMDVAAKLKVTEGDSLFVTDGVDSNGEAGAKIKDPNLARQMEAAENIITRYRNTFQELAK